MRFAAIDIGSNAVRLLISDVTASSDGSLQTKKNTLIRVPLRLGDDAFLDHNLSERKIQDLIKTMAAFKNLIEVYRVTKFRACATSALRECNNGPGVIEQIRVQLGMEIEIIEGKTEAGLIYSMHAERLLDRRNSYLYIDVGGGSTEISLFNKGSIAASSSFDVGTVRILDNLDSDASWDALKKWTKRVTQNAQDLQAIGTGGNIMKLYSLAEQKEGTPLTVSRLKTLYNYLNAFSLKERMQVLGLKEDRADVIVPAAEIFLALARWAGFKQIYVPKAGLVDGIIQDLTDRFSAAQKTEMGGDGSPLVS